MERLQICGLDSQTATAQTHQPPPNPSDRIDYPQAEAALFKELNGPDGYGRVLVADHGRHFGADVDQPESVEELAGALFPKAAQILNQHGTRHVFSDSHLYVKVRQWARHFCDQQSQYQRDKAAATTKNDADRQAHVHATYGGPEGVAKGNNHSALKRSAEVDTKVPEAIQMREDGRTQKEIAQAFKRTPRTIRYWFKREIGAVVAGVVERIELAGGTIEEIVERLRKWKFANCWSGTNYTLFDDGTRKAFSKFPLSDRSGPTPAQNHRAPAKIDAIAGICGLLRQHLARVLLT